MSLYKVSTVKEPTFVLEILVNEILYKQINESKLITESGDFIAENGGVKTLYFDIGNKGDYAKIEVRSADSSGYSDKNNPHFYQTSYKVKSISDGIGFSGNRGVPIYFTHDPADSFFFYNKKKEAKAPEEVKKEIKMIEKYPEIRQFGKDNAGLLTKLWQCTDEEEFKILIDELIDKNQNIKLRDSKNIKEE